MKAENNCLTTLQRLKLFIDVKGVHVSALERLLGFSNGSLATQIKNNKTIGVDKLEKILKFFPRLSASWLLTGEGKMFSENTKPRCYLSPDSLQNKLLLLTSLHIAGAQLQREISASTGLNAGHQEAIIKAFCFNEVDKITIRVDIDGKAERALMLEYPARYSYAPKLATT